jgi:hypothetical protein
VVDENKVLEIALTNLRRAEKFNPYKKYAGVTTREQFRELLSKDPAFGALGLGDDRFVIAKAGGNLVTSLHRKIGDLYEDIFAYLIKETYGVEDSELHFSVKVPIGEREQVRSTDGLIRKEQYNSLIPQQWRPFDGVGFEVRSCYQIGDSKRIQADYDMSLALKSFNIQPVMLIMCGTSLRSPVKRLAKSWEMYEGAESFELIRSITGFDLFGFMQRHSALLRAEVSSVLSKI